MTDDASRPHHRELFAAHRQDETKLRDGVWFTHPSTGDKFLARRLWCAQHVRALADAAETWKRDHGGSDPFEAEDADGKTDPRPGEEVHCTALAAGVVIDWSLSSNPDLEYDAALMTAALLDPELADLRAWMERTFAQREQFRPDAGN